jgi:hypothetical protein
MTFKDIVNKLTNWQRNQWARDGYPGLHKEEIKKIIGYIYKIKHQ